jgi:uncharacterized membrane protein YozB (DUF420 family)
MLAMTSTMTTHASVGSVHYVTYFTPLVADYDDSAPVGIVQTVFTVFLWIHGILCAIIIPWWIEKIYRNSKVLPEIRDLLRTQDSRQKEHAIRQREVKAAAVALPVDRT